LVVGLGNPGKEYEHTRHNVGADVVSLLAERHAGRLRPIKGLRASVDELTIAGRRVALAVPTTYMNESGQAVGPLVERFGLDDLARLVVVHDELDFPPGTLRVKEGGGLAGHNGLRSIQGQLASADFVRIRIGIGKPSDPQRGSDHVLRRPSTSERRVLDQMVARAADIVEVLVAQGVPEAMQQANRDAD
jgi:PTH1 family peptidyl-tRNA hydrolase